MQEEDSGVVVIESGVTEIGANAFDGCTNLGLVFVPKSVTKVGKKAFNRCPNLLVLMESGIAQAWLMRCISRNLSSVSVLRIRPVRSL